MQGHLFLTLMVLITPAALSEEPAPDDAVFRDDLLDNLVGRWSAKGAVHGRPSNQVFEAEWVLNHQFLRITEKSLENIAGRKYPFEGVHYLGYDNVAKRYVDHFMCVWGGNSDALGLGRRTGDQIEITFPYADGTLSTSFAWRADSRTWRIVSPDPQSRKPPILELEATADRAPVSGRQ